MKKLLCIMLIIMLAASLVGCGDKGNTATNPDTTSQTENIQGSDSPSGVESQESEETVPTSDVSGQEASGNTVGNLVNHGRVAFSDGWIYYSNGTQGIWRMKSDGSEKTLVSDDGGVFLNVIDNWIYYSNASDQRTIYRIRTDGTDREQICSDSVTDMNNLSVLGGWVYYTANASDGNIFRVRTDGTEREKLNDEKSFHLNVVDDWIYYNASGDGMYRMYVDGSNKEKVDTRTNRNNFINVIDGYIYFINKDNNICRYEIATKNIEIVNEDYCQTINVSDDFIYYIAPVSLDNQYGNSEIWRCKVNGSDKQKLLEPESTIVDLNIADGWIYFLTAPYNQLHRMNLDGANVQDLD